MNCMETAVSGDCPSRRVATQKQPITPHSDTMDSAKARV